MKYKKFTLFSSLFVLSLTSCAASTSDNATSNAEPIVTANNSQVIVPKVVVQHATINNSLLLPEMTVYKSATCGCCSSWVEHIEKSGFKVSVVDTDDMNSIKFKLGVPTELASCHTAKVGNYFIEGHVPASDIIRLISEKSEALGIGVPGMPLGSPGMEVPSGETQPYTVTQVNKDGSLSIFSSH